MDRAAARDLEGDRIAIVVGAAQQTVTAAPHVAIPAELGAYGLERGAVGDAVDLVTDVGRAGHGRRQSGVGGAAQDDRGAVQGLEGSAPATAFDALQTIIRREAAAAVEVVDAENE